jgi:hypothetical protein
MNEVAATTNPVPRELRISTSDIFEFGPIHGSVA